MNDTEQVLLERLRSKFGGQPTRGDLLAALELDSLGMAEFSVELERLFNVRIDERILEAETVGDLIDYLDGLRRRQRSSGAA